MEVLRNLFEGYPNLWGGGVAHSVLILSLTIAFGIILAKIKVRGVSLGVTWTQTELSRIDNDALPDKTALSVAVKADDVLAL